MAGNLAPVTGVISLLAEWFLFSSSLVLFMTSPWIIGHGQHTVAIGDTTAKFIQNLIPLAETDKSRAGISN